MAPLRFQTCRLLSGNVRKRELTFIQRRILRRLRNKKTDIKRKIYPRENLNSYIQSQTTRKLPLFSAEMLHRIVPFFVSLLFGSLGIPIIPFCDDDEQNSSDIDSPSESSSSTLSMRVHASSSEEEYFSAKEEEAEDPIFPRDPLLSPLDAQKKKEEVLLSGRG